ncbi:PhoH family protein [Lentisphaerota bacterium WC36G]|nr:PhoH family protein [Lentisphaerae bacterium WC36]
MKKVFVLDTNVLLHSAKAIESFEDNDVVLPMSVIEELDRFKKKQDELGRNARQTIRLLDRLRQHGNIHKGVKINDNREDSGLLRIVSGQGDIKNSSLDMDIADNRILRTAFQLQENGENIVFITKDINLRIKADAIGLTVMDFEHEKINFDELYNGCRTIESTEEIINEFYDKKIIDAPVKDLYPNEYTILIDKNDSKHSALGFNNNHGGLELLNGFFDKNSVWNIHPRNKEQKMALDLLMNPDIKLVTLVGQAGSGKTLLALAAALEATLHQSQYEKILVSRPIIPMGNDLGYMPGDKDEKMKHWMQPIFDNLDYLMHGGQKDTRSSSKKIDDLFTSRKMEVEALTYIRGRSIPRQFVIIDEAQNLTPHEVKTIISRAGEGTKMVLTGDPYQIDNPYLDSSSNGLTYTVERMKDKKLHGHITLYKSERSDLAALAAEYL